MWACLCHVEPTNDDLGLLMVCIAHKMSIWACLCHVHPTNASLGQIVAYSALLQLSKQAVDFFFLVLFQEGTLENSEGTAVFAFQTCKLPSEALG